MKKPMFRSLACGLIIAGMLGGCAAGKKEARPSTAYADVVDLALKDASESITADLAALTGSRQHLQFYPEYGGDLYTPVNLTWDGPLQGALASVASKIGYRLVVEGKEPSAPAQIHVKCLDKPALHVLREIGLQTGKDTGVHVQEADRPIRLVYPDLKKGN